VAEGNNEKLIVIIIVSFVFLFIFGWILTRFAKSDSLNVSGDIGINDPDPIEANEEFPITLSNNDISITEDAYSLKINVYNPLDIDAEDAEPQIICNDNIINDLEFEKHPIPARGQVLFKVFIKFSGLEQDNYLCSVKFNGALSILSGVDLMIKGS
jgi:hypothetical protein